jgi:hypothetical protein
MSHCCHQHHYFRSRFANEAHHWEEGWAWSRHRSLLGPELPPRAPRGPSQAVKMSPQPTLILLLLAATLRCQEQEQAQATNWRAILKTIAMASIG